MARWHPQHSGWQKVSKSFQLGKNVPGSSCLERPSSDHGRTSSAGLLEPSRKRKAAAIGSHGHENLSEANNANTPMKRTIPNLGYTQTCMYILYMFYMYVSMSDSASYYLA